jgi:hypothetical protein
LKMSKFEFEFDMTKTQISNGSSVTHQMAVPVPSISCCV